MGVTNSASGTRIDEVAERIYRIHTPIPPSVMPGGFSFNQYLIADDEPILFHTGLRKLFPLVSEAMRRELDYFSHTRHARALLEKLASTEPATLACMHGAAWRGNGAALLRALADALEGTADPGDA